MRAGAIEGQTPAEVNLVISCAPGSAQLQRVPLRVQAEAGGTFRVRFVVPRDKCRAQWLIFDMRGDEETLERAVWVDSVSLRAISGGGGSMESESK
jgi:hypothetical protein